MTRTAPKPAPPTARPHCLTSRSVRPYGGRGDRDVVPKHTQWYREQVAAKGGAVDVVKLGDLDHIGAAVSGCR